MTKTPFSGEERTSERQIDAEEALCHPFKPRMLAGKSRPRAASSAILPLYNYGAWRGKHTRQKRTHIRARVVAAVYGNVGRGPTGPRNAFWFLCPVHTCDPLGAYAWKMLRLWYTHLSHEDGMQAALSEALQMEVPRKKGPFASMLDLFLLLGVTWNPEE